MILKKQKNSSKKTTVIISCLFLVSNLSYSSSGSVDVGNAASSICNFGQTVKKVLDVLVIIFGFFGCLASTSQYLRGSQYAKSNFMKLLIGLLIYALASTIIGIFVNTPCDLDMTS